MKKKISVIILLLLLMITILCTFSYATEIGEDDVLISLEDEEDETSETDETNTYDYDVTYDDIYVFQDEDYVMDEIVDGNAFIFVNGDVTVTGEIAGSMYIISNGTVELTKESYVADALFIMARSIKIDGIVYDIYAICDDFETMENAYICRDIKVMATNAKLLGFIYRDVYLKAGNVEVQDDESALTIYGDFNYTSKQEAEGLEDVVLYGEINFNLEEETEEEIVSVSDIIKQYVLSAITSLVYVIVVYLILKLMSPKFIENVGKDLKEKGIVDFVIGLLVWVIGILALIISFILLFTSIGTPISIIAWIIMVTVVYISSAVLSIAIWGVVKEKVEKIKENKATEVCTLLGIALCLWILQKIPYVGEVFGFIIITTGMGLIIRNIVDRKKLETQEKADTTVQE